MTEKQKQQQSQRMRINRIRCKGVTDLRWQTVQMQQQERRAESEGDGGEELEEELSDSNSDSSDSSRERKASSKSSSEKETESSKRFDAWFEELLSSIRRLLALSGSRSSSVWNRNSSSNSSDEAKTAADDQALKSSEDLSASDKDLFETAAAQLITAELKLSSLQGACTSPAEQCRRRLQIAAISRLKQQVENERMRRFGTQQSLKKFSFQRPHQLPGATQRHPGTPQTPTGASLASASTAESVTAATSSKNTAAAAVGATASPNSALVSAAECSSSSFVECKTTAILLHPNACKSKESTQLQEQTSLAVSSDTGCSSSSTKQLKKQGLFKSLQGVTLILGPSDLQGENLELTDLTDCLVIVGAEVCLARLQRVQRSVVLLRGVSSSTWLTDCRRSLFSLNTHQLRVHDCHDVGFFLSSSSSPIIESTTEAVFAPQLLRLTFCGIHEQAAFATPPAAEKTIEEQRRCSSLWRDVKDFDWIKKTKSPNWRAVSHAPSSAATEILLVPQTPTRETGNGSYCANSNITWNLMKPLPYWCAVEKLVADATLSAGTLCEQAVSQMAASKSVAPDHAEQAEASFAHRED